MKDGGRRKDRFEQNFHQLNIDITPLKGLAIHLQGNVRTTTNFNHTDVQKIYNHDAYGNPYPIPFNSSYSAGQTRVIEYASKNTFYTTNLFADYVYAIKGHEFKILGGFNAELLKSRTLQGTRDGIIVPSVPTLNTTDSEDRATGGYTHWSTAGFFGRLNYNYKNRYLLELNGRYDGTSRFLRNKRWNFFPSFSVGWNIARESFWEPLTAIANTVKIKASWGELGNQNTSSFYPFYSSMPIGIGTGTWLLNGDKTNTANMPGLVSALLTWEKVQSLNIGLDFGLFNNRLTGTIEYFKRTTKDMVGPAPQLPATLGAAVPRVNNADMESKGFDLEISWRDRIGKVSYGIKANLSDAQATVTRYPNNTNAIGDWYTGKKSGEIWGYTTLGIAKSQEEMDAHLASLPNGGQNALGGKWQAGDIMYADLNGDGKVNGGQGTLADPGDRTIIGNSTPRYNFGLILDARYANFDFSVFFQGVGKRDYWVGNGSNGAMFWGIVNNLWQSVGLVNHLDYYRPEGDPLGANLESYYPRPDISTNKNQLPQTRYLQNAAYIRLKNLQVGYSLPKNWMGKLHINKCRIYLSGENLWTGTKLASMFDPETLTGADGWGSGKTYPLSRVYSFGLSINL